MRNRLALFTFLLTVSLVPVSAHAQWQLNGTALSTAASNQLSVTIVSDGMGGAIATWQDLRSGTYDIYAQRVNAAGVLQWTTNDIVLCSANSNQYAPKIISDGVGGAIIVWRDFRTGTNNDIFAQRVNAAGAVQWTDGGVAICDTGDNQFDPAITSDGASGAIVAWSDFRNGNYDIYVQRVTASGVPQWTLDGVAVCTHGNDQSFPAITSDGASGAIVTWYDHRSGTNDDVYVRRVNAAGTPLWTADGVALCVAANNQRDLAIVSNGAGGAIVAWSDSRASSSDIYARMVNAAGMAQWAADGVALSTAAGDQQYPAIVSDGAGGAIVTWQDAQNTDFDIYARRVNASGAAQWTPDGVAVCSAGNDQLRPTIVSDGAGGAIVTWYDNRTGTGSDIYARQVTAAGVVQWTPNGVALSTAANDQLSPAIVSDGAGGAIVAWQDGRSGTEYDIYAQRVSASGFPTAVPDAPAIHALDVLPNRPNPFSGSTEFELHLEQTSDLTIDVYDIGGRRMSEMVLEEMQAGWQRIAFSGTDETGRLLPSGVYFYRVTGTGEAITSKMVIAR